jgi:hypothetical protein
MEAQRQHEPTSTRPLEEFAPAALDGLRNQALCPEARRIARRMR